MSKLRKFAQGQDCQMRIPGVCNFDPSTTVLCHVRLPGICGAGMKPSDLAAFIGCSSCHDAFDRRAICADDVQLRAWALDAVIRTHDLMMSHGVIFVR